MTIDIIDSNYEDYDCEYRLIEAIDNNRLIIIDYIDYIDCLPMIDFHRLGTPGLNQDPASLRCCLPELKTVGFKDRGFFPESSFAARNVKFSNTHIKWLSLLLRLIAAL